MTLSEILNAVMDECGLARETAYATSQQDEIRRLVSFANRSAVRLSTCYEWQSLVKTYSFSLTTATEYDLPEDFRKLVHDTGFAESYIHPIDFKTDPQLWGYLQSSTSATGPRYRFRIMGDKIKVFAPQSGETVRFEYISNAAVLDDDGTTEKVRFDGDSDTWVLDDDLIIMDLVWRYKKLLGLPDWQIDRTDWMSYLTTTQGQDSGAKIISGADHDMRFGEPYTDLWVNNE